MHGRSGDGELGGPPKAPASEQAAPSQPRLGRLPRPSRTAGKGADTEAPESFLSVVEIWRPDGTGKRLKWAGGHYEAAPAFGEAARETTFEMGEGVPGQAWETGKPVLLDGLVGTNFVRTVAAAEAGLGAVLAMPFRRNAKVEAVVLMLMSVRRDLCGVAEIWRPAADGGALALDRGFYSALTQFGAASKDVRFGRGEGLPGRVWQTGRPHVAPDVSTWDAFVRRSPAEADHITTGIGIPLFVDDELESVVTMFGTREVPLARDVTVVLTDAEHARTARIPRLPEIARRWRRPVLRLPVYGPRSLTGLLAITL